MVVPISSEADCLSTSSTPNCSVCLGPTPTGASAVLCPCVSGYLDCCSIISSPPFNSLAKGPANTSGVNLGNTISTIFLPAASKPVAFAT